MQKPCASCNSPGRGVDEVRLKNSTNSLTDMKKIIQSKFDHMEITNRAHASLSPDVDTKPEPSAVQPPLPLVPPPPDEPWMPVTVKQEVEDYDYKDTSLTIEPKTEIPEKVKQKVCRDFIRGTCKRVGCRFTHKYELSELVGIYTFCREFQTKRCTRVHCKYVHADVFEEQNFYRTGYLPVHAFAHQKKAEPSTPPSQVVSPAMPPPPPPPPPPPEETLPMPPEYLFKIPPPPLPVEPSTSSLESPVLDILQTGIRRPWDALESISLYNSETSSPPKKCNHCPIMEFCEQHSKSKLEKMDQDIANINSKIDRLDEKILKMDEIIVTCLGNKQSPYLTNPYW
ncbi:unnamed protein product [Leptosia nina]|uniref:C3H1-type domain-containing protein n=1 Tax=Leptosia nina TaxID=320188 RepID=A0AAV1JAN1_9NEOP